MAMTGRAFLGYDICKGLSFQTSIGGTFYGAHNDTYSSSELETIGKANYGKKSNPVGYSSSGFYFNWLIENQLTYSRDFGDHSLTAVLVQSAQKETYKGNNVTATDYPNDYNQTIGGGTVNDGDSKTDEWSLASYMARVQYSYKGKYMLSAAIRADVRRASGGTTAGDTSLRPRPRGASRASPSSRTPRPCRGSAT